MARPGWRDWMSVLLGTYLFCTPWLFGAAGAAASSRNARIVGVCLFGVTMWALSVSMPRTAGWIKAALGSWLLTAPFMLNFGGPAAWNAWAVGTLTTIVSVGVAGIAFALLSLPRATVLRYQARRLTPQRIVEYRDFEEPPSPERLSQQIVERSDQIYRTLREKPSGTDLEMCALGYRACADDMIALTHLINEELTKSNPIRCARLRSARRRATNSLGRARKALPLVAARAAPRERP